MYLKQQQRKNLRLRHLWKLFYQIALSYKEDVTQKMIVPVLGAEDYTVQITLNGNEYNRPVFTIFRKDDPEPRGQYKVDLLADFEIVCIPISGDEIKTFLDKHRKVLTQLYRDLASTIAETNMVKDEVTGFVKFVGVLLLSTKESAMLVNKKLRSSQLRIKKASVLFNNLPVKSLSEKTTIDDLYELYEVIIVKPGNAIVDANARPRPPIPSYYEDLVTHYRRSEILYHALVNELYHQNILWIPNFHTDAEVKIQKWLTNDIIEIRNNLDIRDTLTEAVKGSPWLTWLQEWNRNPRELIFDKVASVYGDYSFQIGEPKMLSPYNGLTFMIFKKERLIGYYTNDALTHMEDPMYYYQVRNKLLSHIPAIPEDSMKLRDGLSRLLDVFTLHDKKIMEEIPPHLRKLLSTHIDLRLLWLYFNASNLKL